VEVDQEEYNLYREVIARLISGEDPLLELPAVTVEIRRALENMNTSAFSLSKLVAQDEALSDQLLRYASSVAVHSMMPPQNILDVVRILGMDQVGRITMVYTIKCLFTPQSAAHKRLFLAAWDRVILKASTAAFLAKSLGYVIPDHALLGSLMTEIGTLAVLSTFKPGQPLPTNELFIKLCREFAKPLGEMILDAWQIEPEYIELVRNTGNWKGRADQPFDLIDVVNLGLYHSLKARMVGRSLPALSELSAYRKLTHPKNFITDTNELEIVVIGRDIIKAIAESLR
jgi:HD-like signal output (HDOD) protein